MKSFLQSLAGAFVGWWFALWAFCMVVRAWHPSLKTLIRVVLWALGF
ncbi:MAG: hypothetical protein JSS27_01035 [Planctomycetes bacterium]|nr:hypothetical protein [Planctomycetota bacterium]